MWHCYRICLKMSCDAFVPSGDHCASNQILRSRCPAYQRHTAVMLQTLRLPHHSSQQRHSRRSRSCGYMGLSMKGYLSISVWLQLKRSLCSMCCSGLLLWCHCAACIYYCHRSSSMWEGVFTANCWKYCHQLTSSLKCGTKSSCVVQGHGRSQKM